MPEYVKLDQVKDVVEQILSDTDRAIATQRVDKLPTVAAKRDVDLVTVLSYEDGQKAALASIQDDLKDIQNHDNGNRYSYSEITERINGLLKRLAGEQ